VPSKARACWIYERGRRGYRHQVSVVVQPVRELSASRPIQWPHLVLKPHQEIVRHVHLDQVKAYEGRE
jgi:hypothetical protein